MKLGKGNELTLPGNGKTETQVALIGAGNVATHLGIALKQAGYRIRGVYSRRKEHAEALALRLSASSFTDTISLLPRADVYVFCVKDDALAACVEQLAARSDTAGALFIHTAGSVSLDVFRGKATRYGVIYPMQTFSKKRRIDFSRVPLFIEAASADVLQEVRTIAGRLSDSVTPLSSDRRQYLHIAAVFANNFANHCFALAADVLQENGISPSCLLPLIDETVRKLHEMPAAVAQTGPAVRHDDHILHKHLQLLGDNAARAEIYRLLSESIYRKAQQSAQP